MFYPRQAQKNLRPIKIAGTQTGLSIPDGGFDNLGNFGGQDFCFDAIRQRVPKRDITGKLSACAMLFVTFL